MHVPNVHACTHASLIAQDVKDDSWKFGMNLSRCDDVLFHIKVSGNPAPFLTFTPTNDISRVGNVGVEIVNSLNVTNLKRTLVYYTHYPVYLGVFVVRA